jgi:WD40 repeat protein
VAVTPDGQRAVSASADQTLKVWNLGSSLSCRGAAPRNHENERPKPTLSTKYLRDFQSRRELRTLKGHKESVTALAVTPDGRGFGV